MSDKAPVVRSNGAILQRYGWNVQVEGDEVVLSIGNANVKMSYLIAIKLGFKLIFRGKQARRWAGDFGRGWETIAELTDWETEQKVTQAHVVATATIIPKALRTGNKPRARLRAD